jgi:hypothetical protein
MLWRGLLYKWDSYRKAVLRSIFVLAWLGASAPIYAVSPSVDVHIDFGSAPDEATVRLDFTRQEIQESQLLVVALNFNQADIKKGVNSAQVEGFGEYSSHLTGWFVAQQETQELWVGISVGYGQPRATLTLALPGLLRQVQDYPPEYELLYSTAEPTLAQLAGGSGNVAYAEIRSFSVGVPQWGDILDKKSTGWRRATGQTYRLDPKHPPQEPSALVLTANEAIFRRWLDEEGVKFAGGFTFMLVMLHLIPKRLQRFRKILASLIGILLAFVLLHLGGWFPLNWKAMLFEGSLCVGALIVLVVYVTLPGKYADRVLQSLVRLIGREKALEGINEETASGAGAPTAKGPAS